MKSLFISAVVAAGMMVSASAMASKDLATKNGCMGCHVVDGAKTVGPTYKEVAAKRKAGDTAMLVEKVQKGGTGVYGQIPMPPQAAPKAEIEKIVAWVLAGAK